MSLEEHLALDKEFIKRMRTGSYEEASQGLEDFEQGLVLAMQVFDEALVSADPFLMLLAEYTFVVQELESG
ncbi:MAG: hypothetical protein LBR96_05750, partial [Treponema sp.]|nr:hypothetical protein [Treponema sp.]